MCQIKYSEQSALYVYMEVCMSAWFCVYVLTNIQAVFIRVWVCYFCPKVEGTRGCGFD